MRARHAVGLAALALATVAPAVAQEAFPFEDVDFTPDCAPKAAFDRLLTLFVPRYEDTGSAFGAPVCELVSGDVSQVPRLDGAAAWHGLELIEVWFHHGFERGPASFAHGFADGPERIREVWNARGWKLPPAARRAMSRDLKAMPPSGAKPNGALATVTCYRD